MDQEAFKQWNKHFDEKFEQQHPQFVAWYRTTNDYAQGSPARVAFKSRDTMDQYREAMQYGIIDAEIIVPQLEDAHEAT